MMIPDLDEEQAEDITRQVAEAPSLKSSRVQTLKELDQEIDRALPPASEIGVDLSALMRFLTPASMFDEGEVVVVPQLGGARPARTDLWGVPGCCTHSLEETGRAPRRPDRHEGLWCRRGAAAAGTRANARGCAR